MLSTAMDQEIESFWRGKLAGVFLVAPMCVSLERNNQEKNNLFLSCTARADTRCRGVSRARERIWEVMARMIVYQRTKKLLVHKLVVLPFKTTPDCLALVTDEQDPTVV